jgi:hypothetical protein
MLSKQTSPVCVSPWFHFEPPQLLNFNVDADPVPAFDFDMDPDSYFFSDADPASQNDADPDLQHCL